MSFGDGFLDMLTTVVRLEAYRGVTGNGARQYDTLRFYRAYVDATGTLIRTTDGQQIIDSVSVFIHPLEVNADGSAKANGVRLTAIHEDARLSLPDATQASGWATPVLLRVDALNDETGVVQLFVCHC